jgi:hypothetical protein
LNPGGAYFIGGWEQRREEVGGVFFLAEGEFGFGGDFKDFGVILGLVCCDGDEGGDAVECVEWAVLVEDGFGDEDFGLRGVFGGEFFPSFCGDLSFAPPA